MTQTWPLFTWIVMSYPSLKLMTWHCNIALIRLMEANSVTDSVVDSALKSYIDLELGLLRSS